MSNELAGLTIAFLVANEGVEQVELTDPWKQVVDAGGSPRLVAPDDGKVQAFDHLTAADEFVVDVVLDDALVADYDALVLPGGVANPDQLRVASGATEFVRGFVDAGKPIAAICHAPWTLVEAGLVEGRTLTSWPSLKTDIENAGGTWVDKEVVVCDCAPSRLVTSRNPDDLPAFNSQLVETFGAVSTDREAVAPGG